MRDHRPVNVFDFGAAGDGGTLDTAAVQQAIDACHEQGGGTVLFPTGGRFLIGSIQLRSHVTLEIAANAVVLGSRDMADYAIDAGLCPYYPEPMDRCLIYATGAANIGLTGRGTINGQGIGPAFRQLPGTKGRDAEQRPMLIRFVECENISITDLTLTNSAAWCVHLARSSNIRLSRVSIFNERQDGFNIESCNDVTISDCNLRCGDDGIALTANPAGRPLRNVTVTNCIIYSNWAAVRLGPLSKDGFENIAVSNCIFYNCSGGGIKIGMYEGAVIRDCVFSNIVMDRVTCPILIFLGTWPEIGSAADSPPMMPVGEIRNLKFSHIRVNAIGRLGDRPDNNATLFFHGHPQQAVENITLNDVHVTFPGGGSAEHAARRDIIDVDEIDPGTGGYWTDNKDVWGVSPAYGLYARHIKGLTLRDVRFELSADDARPAVFCSESSEIEVLVLKAACGAEAPAVLAARDCQDVVIDRARPLGPAGDLVRLEGEACRAISISNSRGDVSLADGASADEVTEA